MICAIVASDSSERAGPALKSFGASLACYWNGLDSDR